MPRNVVTLVPRRSLLRRRHGVARAEIVAELADRFRPSIGEDGRIEMYFSPRYPADRAKADVATELDGIDPGWRRLFRLYPTEQALEARRRGSRHRSD
ncbi:MAG: hypothetical protein ACRDNY_09435 [Gaiellaceae bacterium]